MNKVQRLAELMNNRFSDYASSVCDDQDLSAALEAAIDERVRRGSDLSPVLQVVCRLMDDDQHDWSLRPCPTCQAISQIRGRPFGCERRAQEAAKRAEHRKAKP